MNTYTFTVHRDPDHDAEYIAWCSEFPASQFHASTPDQAIAGLLRYIADALEERGQARAC